LTDGDAGAADVEENPREGEDDADEPGSRAPRAELLGEPLEPAAGADAAHPASRVAPHATVRTPTGVRRVGCRRGTPSLWTLVL
jgi:hypothetical protein